MSALRPLPRFLALDPGLFPDAVTVERARTLGVDAAGEAVVTWDPVYGAPLACLVDLHEAGERGTSRSGGAGRGGAAGGVFGQPTEEIRAAVYFPPLPAGGLPDVRKRDRLVYGTWQDGSVRYIDVTGAFDAGKPAGIVLEAVGTARKPG
jgi:hypothetical protein